MEQPVQFRPAFNGFNREDVVRYMEYINNKHSARVAQLTNELDFLRSHDSAAKVAELEQQLAQAEAQNQFLTSRIAELEQQAAEPMRTVRTETEAPNYLLDKLEAKWKEPQTPPVVERAPIYTTPMSAPAPAPIPVQTSAHDELEAYRRAERAERLAKERALQVSSKTAAVLTEASQKVDIASELICQISRQVAEQLEIAQAAVMNSRQAFQEASSVIEDLRSQMKD